MRRTTSRLHLVSSLQFGSQKVVIRSAISTHHKRFDAVKKPSTRANALSSLPPLPRGSDPENPFPTFPISYLSSLVLPLRPMPSVPAPPSTRQSAPVASRLANPFASLFSSRSSVASPPSTVPPRPSSPRPPSIRSEASVDHPNSHSVDGHMVSVCVIDRKVVRKDVAAASSKALRSLIQMKLDGLPTWLVDCILRYRTCFSLDNGKSCNSFRGQLYSPPSAIPQVL